MRTLYEAFLGFYKVNSYGKFLVYIRWQKDFSNGPLIGTHSDFLLKKYQGVKEHKNAHVSDALITKNLSYSHCHHSRIYKVQIIPYADIFCSA